MDTQSPTRNLLRRGTKTILQSVGHLLWPGRCMNCRENAVEEGDLCGECWEGITSVCGAQYCRRCGREASPYAIGDGVCANCRDEQINFDGIARAGVYDKALRETILAFKHGRTELNLVLGGLLNSAFEASNFYNEIELFVPVPLHWFKRLSRGFNQSYILTRQLRHPLAKISTDLARIRNTEEQPNMKTPFARVKNMTGAFAVRHGHQFAGRSVCLVDDVKTTGATLNECARILKEAGALKVFALVLSVAGQHTK
jgi:ComF family protein